MIDTLTCHIAFKVFIVFLSIRTFDNIYLVMMLCFTYKNDGQTDLLQ